MTTQEIAALAEAIRKAHPYYDRRACLPTAERLAAQLPEGLEAVVCRWLATGQEEDYRHGSFCLYGIMEMQGVSYVDAVDLLADYIHEPETALCRILPL